MFTPIHLNPDSPFYELLSCGEAAQIWGLEQSTVRKWCLNGTLELGTECWKFGKQWVISAKAMCRVHKSRNKWVDYVRGLESRYEEEDYVL